MINNTNSAGIAIDGPPVDGSGTVLDGAALGFLAALTDEFRDDIDKLLAARRDRQARLDAGELPHFLPQTQDIRESDWQVVGAPPDLRDRRVEISGPADRWTLINALNSGAQAFTADCEDSLSPTWQNVIRSQINLRAAVDGNISLTINGKHLRLNERTATLIVRPRGWHLEEKHLHRKGRPLPAALVDFGLYLLHNHRRLQERGTGPYFNLPKLENHLEARLWAGVFRFAESYGSVGPGRIRVTVSIDTIFAAFELDEILHELRDFAVGTIYGRQDYVFSFIRAFSRFPDFILPDRADIAATAHFLRSLSLLAIRTSHRRGASATGAMAVQVPSRNDPDANDIAIADARADMAREAADGHDGTGVAHPDLVPVAAKIFDRDMPASIQLARRQDEVGIDQQDLLQVPRGRITGAGMRQNIRVAVLYLAAWQDGVGCVPIDNRMANTSAAEVARAQLWQWVHQPTGILDEGVPVDAALFRQLVRDELGTIRAEVGANAFDEGRYRDAAETLERLTLRSEFTPFIAEVLYDRLP